MRIVVTCPSCMRVFQRVNQSDSDCAVPAENGIDQWVSLSTTISIHLSVLIGNRSEVDSDRVPGSSKFDRHARDSHQSCTADCDATIRLVMFHSDCSVEESLTNCCSPDLNSRRKQSLWSRRPIHAVTEWLQACVAKCLRVDRFDLIISELKSFEDGHISEDLPIELLSEMIAVEIQLFQFRSIERGDRGQMIPIEFENFQRWKDIVHRRWPLRQPIRGQIQFLQMSQSRQDRQIDVIQPIVFQRKDFQVQRQIQLIDRFQTIVVEIELAQMIQMNEKGQMFLCDQFVVA